MKRISLLYNNADAEAALCESRLSEAIYNLNIDRAVYAACKNTQCAQYFLSVIEKMPSGTECAEYRSGILKDFLKYPKLLSALMQIFRGYDGLREETDEMTREIFRFGVPTTDSGMLDCVYEQLYVNAHFARSVIAYFSEIDRAFSGCEVESEGLNAMKEICASVRESKCIDEIEKAAERFKSESVDGYSFTVKCSLDKTLSAVKSEIAEINAAGKGIKKRLLPTLKRKEAPSSVDIGNAAAESIVLMTAEALDRLSKLFSDIANGIYSAFFGIGRELKFYYSALEIAGYLKERGMNYCFPTVLEKSEDVFKATSLYDILLLSEGKSSDTVVTNSAEISGNGLIITGDNNCGKTSFLRAVGTAVIFAQSGLFVPADGLTVSVRSGIFTHFSSAEKDFTDTEGAAGRFESEVIDISKIIDKLTPYSLVMLNETFQTTAYREGAEGMKEILDVFSEINVKYIFVTHIKAMLSEYKPEGAAVLRAEKYNLVPSGENADGK